jgi:hypothetical protein
MSTISEISYVETIIDLRLAVLRNIDVGYLGYRPYTREQEKILQIINHVRGTLMYYTMSLSRAVAPPEGNSKGKVGKNMKRSRTKRGCGGVAGGSEDDDYEAQADSRVKLNHNVKPKMGDSKEIPSSSSASCVEVEVVAESPVTMTIASSSSSSSSSDDDAEGGYVGGKTGLTSSSESSESEEDENTNGGGANTGGGDANLDEDQDVGTSSSDDREEE